MPRTAGNFVDPLVRRRPPPPPTGGGRGDLFDDDDDDDLDRDDAFGAGGPGGRGYTEAKDAGLSQRFADDDVMLQDSIRELFEDEKAELRRELELKQHKLDALQKQVAELQAAQRGDGGDDDDDDAARPASPGGGLAGYAPTGGRAGGAGSGAKRLKPPSAARHLSHRALLHVCSNAQGAPLEEEALQLVPARRAQMARLRGLRALRLARQRLGSADVRRLCRQLDWLPAVLEVDLSNNGLGDECCQELSALLKSPALTALDLSHNRFGAPAVAVLAHELARNRTLQRLDVSANPLIANAATAGAQLLGALAGNVALWHLAISAADVPPMGLHHAGGGGRGGGGGHHGAKPRRLDNGKAMAALPLKQTEHRRALPQQERFYHTPGRNTAMTSVPAQKVGAVQALCLCYAQLGRGTLVALGAHLGALTSLDLRHSWVGGAGCRELARALGQHGGHREQHGGLGRKTLGARCRLTSLNLRQNGIGSSGAAALFAALGGGANDHLTHLDVSGNGLRAAALPHLAAALRRNNTLTLIDLSRNALGEKAVAVLARLLRTGGGGGALTSLGDLSTVGGATDGGGGNRASMLGGGLTVRARNELAGTLRRNAEALEDDISARVRRGLSVVHYEPHEVVQTVTGGSARLQHRHGLQMHCVSPLQGHGALRLEWRAQVAFTGGGGGAGSGFQWCVTRRSEGGVESVVTVGDQDAATAVVLPPRGGQQGGGGRKTYCFDVGSSDWRENESLSLWMKPVAGGSSSGSAASTCKLRVSGFMVSVEEGRDRGLIYSALKGTQAAIVPLRPPGGDGGGGAEPARAAGMRRLRGVFLSAGGTVRASWRLKVVDTLGGRGSAAIGFRWLLSRRFCMAEEVAVAEGTDQDFDADALAAAAAREGGGGESDLLPFEALLEGCSAEDTLCLWVGPKRGERWAGGVGAQTAHLAELELRLEKPNTAIWTPRPVLNFASTRPFEPMPNAQWVL